MQVVTRRRYVGLGILIAVALAAVALILPPLCEGASGKDRPEKADQPKEVVKDKAPAKTDEEPLGDFWIDLKKKEGKERDEAVEAVIRDMLKRMEAIENQMDELIRRSPWDRDLRAMPRWENRMLRQRDRDLDSELKQLLREMEQQSPRDWPLRLQELIRELERDLARGSVRRFEWGPGTDLFPFGVGKEPGRPDITLRMDMEETDDAYVLKLDMPGMDKGDIAVKVEDNVLSVSGERKERVEQKKDGQQVHREIVYGRFERTMTLPSDADSEKITSKYDNGVLVITIPKKEDQAEKGKRIIVHQR